MIFEKLKIVEINTIKFCSFSCIGLILVLFIYSMIKLYEAYIHFSKAQSLFDDYSIVTFEYSMIMNYFNNMNLLMINQKMGNEDFMEGMQNRVEAQFKKSEKVKQKSIKNYPKINKLFSSLNNEEDSEEIRLALCKENLLCNDIFNSKYNMVKKGIDFGLKTAAQEIYNIFKDYLSLKNNITKLNDVKKYFMTEDFSQIALSLNFLLSMVEDRCAETFLLEAQGLTNSFQTVIISLNISIIVLLVIISLSLIFLIINRITILLNLIEKSSMRISISINFMKEKIFGAKNKTGSLL